MKSPWPGHAGEDSVPKRLEAAWRLGQVGPDGFGPKERVKLSDERVRPIVAAAPDVAGRGAAEVEAGSGGRVGFVDGEEAVLDVEQEEGVDVEGHEVEVGQHGRREAGGGWREGVGILGVTVLSRWG